MKSLNIGAAVLIVFGVLLLVKDKVASKAGKVLLIIAGAIFVLFSSFLGFPARVVVIVGASMLLASIKKYK